MYICLWKYIYVQQRWTTWHREKIYRYKIKYVYFAYRKIHYKNLCYHILWTLTRKNNLLRFYCTSVYWKKLCLFLKQYDKLNDILKTCLNSPLKIEEMYKRRTVLFYSLLFSVRDLSTNRKMVLNNTTQNSALSCTS